MVSETICSCAVCGGSATQRCGGCGGPHYCGKQHQKEHWSVHKKQCKSYKICDDDLLGRHLVASRDIKAGEVVLRESPLLRGPSQVTGPVCVGCLEDLGEESIPCVRCGWSVCDIKCQESKEHKEECDFTTQHRGKVNVNNFITPHPLYQCVTPLRVLLASRDSSKASDRLASLESHGSLRKGTAQWIKDKHGVADFMQRFFRDIPFCEDDILRACGLLQVNAHEVPLTSPPHIAVYDITSFLEHSCLANCCKSFNNNGDVVIWSAKDIPKGEHLSISYTDSLWGTENRQMHLYESKLFTCKCARCNDVTELETHFSSIRCPITGCGGVASPDILEMEQIQNNSTNNNAIIRTWRCTKCQIDLNKEYVQNVLQNANDELRDMEKGCEETCLNFLTRYSDFFPTNHYIMTDVRMALAHLIGSGDDPVTDIKAIKTDRLKLKHDMCKELISLLKRIAPGECRARGSLWFELHAALAEMARRSITVSPSCTQRDTLQLSLLAAEESVALLSQEASCMPEGMLCSQAKQNLKDLNKIFV